MNEKDASHTALYVVAAVVVLIPLAVNAFKVLAWGYGLAEIWRHLLLDLAVVALLVLVLLTAPLKQPLIYGALYLVFCAAYLNANPPASGWEWFGTIVALLLVAAVFPRLHKVTPYVTLGLLIGYVAVIRVMLPSMSRAEAQAVLDQRRPELTASALLHDTFGYERFFIGQEKFRCYLLRDAAYGARLAALAALHASTLERLHAQGIDWLRWNELPGAATPNADATRVTVAFPGGVLPGKQLARGNDGVALDCQARVGPFQVTLRRLDDGTFRVVEVPAEVAVERVDPSPGD